MEITEVRQPACYVLPSSYVCVCVLSAAAGTATVSPLYLQDQVDRADAFPQVLKKVIEWMKSKELGTKYKYCILTDG